MPDQNTSALSPSSPVQNIPRDSAASKQPRPGIGLCLSGGGYRAMLFHLGTLIRLNEAGILKKLRRISSVSGGSITSGVLGFKWNALVFQNDIATNLQVEVIDLVRKMAD